MVSVSVSGVSASSKPRDKIAPEAIIVSTLWKSGDELDPPPPAPPGFQCKCKRCAKKTLLTVTPTSESDKLELFRNRETLCLNTGGDSYLKIYTGEEETPANLIISCERVRKKGDSCIIFIDVWGRIIFQSEREGDLATVKSGDTTLGVIRGSPGGFFSFRRNFSIMQTYNSETEPDRRIKLRATGCLSNILRCSAMNAFYLDEFIILDPEGGEMGWIRKGGNKKVGPIVTFSPNIKDDTNAKGLIIAAAATLFELFMQPYFGFNLGSVGYLYVLVAGFIGLLLGIGAYVYHYGPGALMVF